MGRSRTRTTTLERLDRRVIPAQLAPFHVPAAAAEPPPLVREEARAATPADTPAGAPARLLVEPFHRLELTTNAPQVAPFARLARPFQTPRAAFNPPAATFNRQESPDRPTTLNAEPLESPFHAPGATFNTVSPPDVHAALPTLPASTPVGPLVEPFNPVNLAP